MFVSRSNSRQHHRRQRKRRLRRLVIVNFILLAAAALLVGGFLWNRTDPSASGGGSSASSGGSGSGGTSLVPDVSSDPSPAPSPSPPPSASPEQPSPTPEPGEQPSPSLSPTPEPTVSATPKATLPPAVSTNPGSGWSGDMPKDAGAVRLAFTGDILLASKVADQMEANGLDYPFKGAAPYLSKPDLTAGNLETPITLRGTPAEDKQYVFKGKPGYLKPLKDAGFDVVTVANNHTLDQGTEGLLDTMKYLDDVKLPHVGGGRNDKEAFAPVILSSKGVKIAYIGVSRVLPVTDWMAGPKRIGVAEAYNSARAVEAIKSAKEKADLVVVMVHWGTERSDQPNAQQKSLARDLVDAGADLVIGAHPHVLQGFELYKGKWIAYSLGNFIFTSNSNSKTSETGVLDAVCSKEGNCGLQFHPMKITLSRPAPLEGEEAATLLKRLNGISSAASVGTDGMVKAR
ncbi:CapA family protein [Paenibacillus sp. P22]|uniref:CapA family protein n=1 Tax=Paenibacillus sp. P22 TaxID=483908 RepID=UPI00043693AF|nr:CapA family protein [Paenibacillus sp. P22]CDN44721.1 Capsule synthesis protein, CapA [Paenibacillus sp. P22]